MLTERKSRILRIIANDYISTAVPVASSAVAKAEGLDVSPATVRNDMATLEEDGYIHRPHISAGSVPSDKGYRQLVDWLRDNNPVDGVDAQQVRTGLEESPEDLDEWATTAANILASLLDTVAFAMPLQSSTPSIKGIQLLELQEMLVMLVVVMKEAVVYRQLLNTKTALTSSELEQTRNRVNSLIAGKSLAALKASRERPEEQFDRQVVDSTIEVVHRHEVDKLKSRKLQGLSRLFKQPEFEADSERAQMAVAAIESDFVFEDLASAASPSTETVTFIGAENRHGSLKKFSVIVRGYGIEEEATGAVGILAPTRLAYHRAIPVVTYAGTSLNSIIRRVYGHE